MGTTITEGFYVSASGRRRPGNRGSDLAGFRDFEQRGRAAPDVEKTLHQPENALAAKGLNGRSITNGDDPASGRSVLRKPTPGHLLENEPASAGHDTSAQAAEGAMIDQILSGRKELFLDLIRPHQRTVYAAVFALLANREDAEDATQDVLLKALARLYQFRRESAFGTWLVQIAINEARMRKRKLRHGRMFSLTNAADDDGAYVPRDFADWREIPSEALERSEIRAALDKALTLLEEHYRLAFILRDVKELSTAETADILGITRGAVKTRLRRARLMLRDILSAGLQQGGQVGLAFKEVRKPWE
jgi:RNA polymerase sigma-70 factor, ECF subfamily